MVKVAQLYRTRRAWRGGVRIAQPKPIQVGMPTCIPTTSIHTWLDYPRTLPVKKVTSQRNVTVHVLLAQIQLAVI